MGPMGMGRIDLHVHTSTGSDGAMTLEGVLRAAARASIGLLSITDHAAVGHQARARRLAIRHRIRYLTGVELSVSFPHGGGDHRLDVLGYGYDDGNPALRRKIAEIREYDAGRAARIVENLNRQFRRENRPPLTGQELDRMREGVEGVLGRPHIADYLVRAGIVADRREAFDRYLVACNVPRYPLRLGEASRLVRQSGGRLVLAHPNDPESPSLASVTGDLREQTRIIAGAMLGLIDGIECWHSRADAATAAHYAAFCRDNRLILTGGSDCHQKPLLLGTVAVPDFVAEQF